LRPDESLTAAPDLLTAAAVGIVAVDARARIVSANTAALAMLGCAIEDIAGLDAREALNNDRPAAECELEAAVRDGRSVQIDDDTFRRRDGEPLPVWWATNPLRDPDNETLLGAVLVFGDTTARRAKAAAENARGRAELAEARQNVDYLRWAAEVTKALSSTLDEDEVLRRLVRFVVGRLCDLAVVDAVRPDGSLHRIAVTDDQGLGDTAMYAVSAQFDRAAATYRATPSPATGVSDTLVLPLVARGQVVGGLCLMRVAGSPAFDDATRLVATDICQRAALAVDNARLFSAQADIATRLQRALLPALPERTLVRAAVRYLPARERFDVGGDWYDLFRLPEDSDTTVLVVGDVAGHDLAAGTTMSALRNLLRGVSVATAGSMGHILESVDANLDALGITGVATVLMMTATPNADDPTGSWTLRWSNAGHMPPLLALPGRIEMLNEVHGPLLGTGLRPRRPESELVVPAGSTLVLYTDGLVEQREETIDAGLTRLRRTAIALTSPLDDPDAVADELLARSHASMEDDTAMLVCHLPHVRS
jgi:PAS domain S-box-containing protein